MWITNMECLIGKRVIEGNDYGSSSLMDNFFLGSDLFLRFHLKQNGESENHK
jgi:hypothetical protein